jgi:DNA-binding response OmpR family regulator
MRILFVDNHPEFTAIVVPTFLAADTVVIVPTIAEAKQCFASASFDVVLVDYDLDDGKGDEFVRWLRTTSAVRIVGVSARDRGNEALVAAGADAVCAKIHFSKIQHALSGREPTR